MQVEPTVTGHRMRIVAAIDSDVRARLDKLSTYYPSIITARVMIEPSDRRHQRGRRYAVHIELMVPEGQVAITHEPNPESGARAGVKTRLTKADEVNADHKHLQVAVRDAFAVARRRLQDYARKQRGDVKRHTAAKVTRAAGRRRAV